jgi:hypothetical protein
MRCCIASSTTSRLKDKHNQSFVGTTIYVQAMGRPSDRPFHLGVSSEFHCSRRFD